MPALESHVTTEYLPARGVNARTGGVIARVISENSLLISCCLFHGIASYVLLYVVNRNPNDVWMYGPKIPVLLVVFCVLFFFGYILWAIFVIRPPSLFGHMRHEFWPRIFTAERWLNMFIAIACIGLSLSAFTAVKSAIPEITSYTWDKAFHDADKALHFGTHPWQYLQAFLGDPQTTQRVNDVYHSWFLVLYSVYFWQAFARSQTQLRQQFLATFVLIWLVLGNVLALMFASAGPCYYHFFTGDEAAYGPLLSYLHEVHAQEPMRAIEWQGRLWEAFVDRSVGLGTGISAAPSIHVAMVTLMALLGWRIHWFWGTLLTTYAVLILIGSVHLGWHYALDGYFAIVATVALWWIVGKYLSRRRCDARE